MTDPNLKMQNGIFGKGRHPQLPVRWSRKETHRAVDNPMHDSAHMVLHGIVSIGRSDNRHQKRDPQVNHYHAQHAPCQCAIHFGYLELSLNIPSIAKDQAKADSQYAHPKNQHGLSAYDMEESHNFRGQGNQRPPDHRGCQNRFPPITIEMHQPQGKIDGDEINKKDQCQHGAAHFSRLLVWNSKGNA
jgi:hypothetical protein